MRIAVLAPYFYPAHKAGGPIPGILGALSSLVDEDVEVITSDRDLGDKEPYGAPFVGTTRVGDVDASYLPPLSLATWRRWLDARKRITRADAVYFNSVHSKLFTILPILALATVRYSGVVVLSPRGELAPSALRLGSSRLKKVWIHCLRRLGWYQSIGRRGNVVWLASSEGERADVLEIFPRARVRLSPEQLRPPTPISQAPRAPKTDVLRILSVGRIAPVKGVDDFLRGLQRVTTTVSVDFVGLAEDESFELAMHDLAETLPRNVSVIWSGAIPPDQVATRLRSSDLSVSLTHGENFGHAIGESLQAGCPVMISDQTPWSFVEGEGAGVVLLDAQCREPESVANAIDEFAALRPASWEAMSARAAECGARGLRIEGSVTLLAAIESVG